MFYIFASFFYTMSGVDFAKITMSNETGSEYQVNNGYTGGVYNGAISLFPYGIFSRAVTDSHFAILQNNLKQVKSNPNLNQKLVRFLI